jgi:hypothetical protein
MSLEQAGKFAHRFKTRNGKDQPELYTINLAHESIVTPQEVLEAFNDKAKFNKYKKSQGSPSEGQRYSKFNADDKTTTSCLYVGSSKNICARLLQH